MVKKMALLPDRPYFEIPIFDYWQYEAGQVAEPLCSFIS